MLPRANPFFRKREMRVLVTWCEGGEILGPDLSDLGREQRLSAIEESLRKPDARIAPGYRMVTARLRDGHTIRGFCPKRD